MRMTITPLGATGRSVSSVAAAVVDYLEGARRDPGAALFATDTGAATAYYADSPEGPGRWLGAGAAFNRLAGAVERDSFQRVLDGRHPISGVRLLTALGSSQRGHLAVGTAAAFDGNGEAMFTVADTASLLGLRRTDVEELITVGAAGGGDPLAATWLETVAHTSGQLVPDREISRHLDIAATPTTGAHVLGRGHGDDQLGTAQAANALGVTQRYIRRLCDAYLSERADATSSAGHRAVLPCRRDGDAASGRYLITRSDLAAFADARKPPVARVGFDVTLTCEKSLGLLALLADADRQPTILRALRSANETGVSFLDRTASRGRRRGAPVHTEGLLIASYLHGTSRGLDPHPHFHNVIANAVVDENGDVRTLDARGLYRHAPAAAALASAQVRWELRELGLGWREREDGGWEVAGVCERAISEFSRRRNEIDEVKAAIADRLGRPLSHDEGHTVAMTTRDAKQAVDPGELRTDWTQRATAVGLRIGDCFDRRVDRAIAHGTLPERLVTRLHEDLVHPASGLCACTSTFDRGDVITAVANWAIDDGGHRRKVLLPPVEIERLTDDFLATAHVAEVATDGFFRRRDGSALHDGQDEAVFTTTELLQVQAEIQTRYNNGLLLNQGVVSPEHLQHLTDNVDGVMLSDEQRDLVTAWCTSGQRVQAAVGRAGTGKTTAMRAAATAWTTAGYRAIGCAVKGEAARQLAADAHIEADTVALLLARANAGHAVLDPSTVLIVDEASTLGDRDLLALLRLADHCGATIRLIGDTAQHGSVPAGGSYTAIVNQRPEHTPQLTEVRRLRDAGERHRADLVRDGQITTALDDLQASGQLVLTDSDAETYAAMLNGWYNSRQTGRSHPMVHGRNRQRRLLNHLAQQLLATDGHVDLTRSVTLGDGRRLAVGDEVIARHGDRAIHPPGESDAWMRNGTTGRIVGVHPGITAAEDRIDIDTAGGTITCGRNVFDRRRGGIDLGYAVTSYAVQGSTSDASTSAVTISTARSELYVDMTRGRHRNQLYATRTTAVDATDAHLPQVAGDVIPALQQKLARQPAPTPFGRNPGALPASTRRRGNNLSALLAARRRGETSPVLAEAINQATAAVCRQARSAPPPALTRIVGDRPTIPHLAARWDALAGDVAVYRAGATYTGARRAHSRAAIEEVLGERPNAPDDSARWDELTDRVTTLAVTITTVTMQRSAGGDLGGDNWLRGHLERLARARGVGILDLTALRSVIADVDRYRQQHNVEGPDPLGPPPHDRQAHRDHQRLAQRLAMNGQQRPTGRGVA